MIYWTIDTGANIGLAIWYRNIQTVPSAKGVLLGETDQLAQVRDFWYSEDSWKKGIDSLMKEFRIFIGTQLRPDMAYIEMPKFMESYGVSARSGALIKLVFMAGRIAEALSQKCIPWTPVDVSQWKGQASKQAVHKEMRRQMNDVELNKCNGSSDHIWDAVGIGMHLQGRLG